MFPEHFLLNETGSKVVSELEQFKYGFNNGTLLESESVRSHQAKY